MENFNSLFSKQGSALIDIIESTGYTSHSEIIKRLNVGRDEFHEILLELSKNGFEFDHHPYAGLKLVGVPDLLTPELIRNSLHTEKIGKRIYHSTSIKSTNSKAVELALKGAPEGTLLVAEYQSHGRGRLRRKWESPPFSSILATLILKPFSLSLGHIVVLITALSVVQLLRKMGIDAYIRWPNDVVVREKKICGILAESGVNYLVCGFGLNVNQRSFSSSLSHRSTSVGIELHKYQSRPVMLKSILQNFEENYEELLAGNPQDIMERIREFSWLLGKRVKLQNGNSVVMGVVLDLDGSGALVLKQDCGKILKIFPQEASVLNE